MNLRKLLPILCFASTSALASDFPACLDRLENQALADGVSQNTVDLHLRTLEPIERVVSYDRSQPEFTSTFADYYQNRINDWRISRGQQLLEEHKVFLGELTKSYGIPGHYLVAFWGLETNYGGYRGKIPTLGALVTLACDNRRSEYFSQELVNALKVVERESLDPTEMVGSWAGAMGHTQFMPTTYLNYAIDGDGDGKVDLWNSAFDALASAANYLSKIGWERELMWGREVRLPKHYDFSHVGLGNAQSLSAWRQAGFTTIWGAPVSDLDVEASLLLPMGSDGPAFLVYKNFSVIKRWNNSNSYAIAVGMLSNQIRGSGGLKTEFPLQAPRLKSKNIELQQRLSSMGYDTGGADGIIGSKSRAAIRAYQLDHNLPADGYASDSLLEILGLL